jgi:hypothetical protein
MHSKRLKFDFEKKEKRQIGSQRISLYVDVINQNHIVSQRKMLTNENSTSDALTCRINDQANRVRQLKSDPTSQKVSKSDWEQSNLTFSFLVL